MSSIRVRQHGQGGGIEGEKEATARHQAEDDALPSEEDEFESCEETSESESSSSDEESTSDEEAERIEEEASKGDNFIEFWLERAEELKWDTFPMERPSSLDFSALDSSAHCEYGLSDTEGGGIVIKPSVGKGLGAFADQQISRNVVVGIYWGELLQNNTCTAKRNDSDYVFAIDKNLSIDAADPTMAGWTRYINHERTGKQRNLDVCVDHRDKSNLPMVWFRSNRDIQLGEELLFNYGQSYWRQHAVPVTTDAPCSMNESDLAEAAGSVAGGSVVGSQPTGDSQMEITASPTGLAPTHPQKTSTVNKRSRDDKDDSTHAKRQCEEDDSPEATLSKYHQKHVTQTKMNKPTRPPRMAKRQGINARMEREGIALRQPLTSVPLCDTALICQEVTHTMSAGSLRI